MRTKGILFQLLTAVGLVLIFSVSQAAITYSLKMMRR